MLNYTRIPAPRVTIVDPQTGIVSNEWFRFFNNLYTIAYAATGSVTPGTYGSATAVPQITVDDFGTITGIINVPIAIDASQIVSGIIASARISGAYTGITGVGTLTAGTWNASTITTSYGGTGLTSYTAGDTLYYASGSALSNLAIGASTYINTSSGTAPQWTDPTTITIGKAANLVGGAANRIAYQTAADTTGFIVAPTVSNTYLEWSGTAFQWSSNPLGTVTSVAALTIGTTGTDLSSTVANGTTTPVITLQVPTASSVNRGALSAADWTTFNSKAPGITFTTNYIPYGQGTTTLNQSASLQFDGTTLSTVGLTTTGNTILGNASTDTLNVGNNGLVKDASGNVMIGNATAITSSAGRGYLLVNGSSNALIDFGVSGASVGYIYHTGTDLRLFNAQAGALQLYTSGAERMRIDSAGNVGIGTSSPVSILDVAGTTPALTIKDTQNKSWVTGDTAGDLDFYSADTSGTGPRTVARIRSFADATATTVAGALSFWTSAVDSAATEKMRIDSSGDVGIGNTNPTAYLDVGDAASTSTMDANGAGQFRIRGGSQALAFAISSTSLATIYTNSSAGALAFGTNETERMRIDSAGNTYVQTGTLWQYAPAPTSKAAAATLTAAEVKTGILNTTGTIYTITLPTGTALDTAFAGVPTTNIGFDWFVVNSASGIITIAVGASGMTSVGTLTIATGVSAQFRLRRTAANTYVLYRLG